MKKILAVVAFAASFSAVDLMAEEDRPWSATASVGTYSDYMFRGLQFYDGTSVQPALSGSYSFGDAGSLNASVWSHFSSENNRKSEAFTEIDYTLSYSYALDGATVSLGHIFYTYPKDNTGTFPATQEYFATVALDLPLTPTVSFFHDYDEFTMQYYELGFSQEVTPSFLGDGFNATPYISLGFVSNAEELYDDNGLAHITFGSSFKTSLGDFGIVPSVNYTAKVDDNTRNEFWIGFRVDYAL